MPENVIRRVLNRATQNIKLDTDNNLLFKNNNGIQNLLPLHLVLGVGRNKDLWRIEPVYVYVCAHVLYISER